MSERKSQLGYEISVKRSFQMYIKEFTQLNKEVLTEKEFIFP